MILRTKNWSYKLCGLPFQTMWKTNWKEDLFFVTLHCYLDSASNVKWWKCGMTMGEILSSNLTKSKGEKKKKKSGMDSCFDYINKSKWKMDY